MTIAAQDRYSRVAILLHWILAAALAGQLAFGWVLGEFAKGTPARAIAINLHKSTGIIFAVVILLRIYWRIRHRPPPFPAHMPRVQVLAAKAGHFVLYTCMFAMPLTGYLASNFSRHGVNFLTLVPLPPWGPDDKALYALFNGAHDALAFVFTAAVIGHVAMALYHSFIARDGLSARMAIPPVR